MMSHTEALKFAVEAAFNSPCQSKRGVVIWDEYGVVSVGCNHISKPYYCDGSVKCKLSCSRTAIHAEQIAIIEGNRSRLIGAQMLHIKVVDGLPHISDGPSCLMCAKLLLAAGLAGMWLFHLAGWKFYPAVEFMYRSSHAGDHLPVLTPCPTMPTS